MEQSKKMLEVILKIIYESEVKDLKDLAINTIPLKDSKNFKQFLMFDHRTHSNYFIQLKNCEEFHCIECLSSSAKDTCIHEKQLTPYEMNLSPFLIKQMPNFQENRVKYKKCRSCLQLISTSTLDKHSCLCAICDNCLVTKYKSRLIKCEYCNKKIKYSKVKKISKELGIPTERLKECTACKLIFNSSVLKNKVCTLCEFKVNH